MDFSRGKLTKTDGVQIFVWREISKFWISVDFESGGEAADQVWAFIFFMIKLNLVSYRVESISAASIYNLLYCHSYILWVGS